MGDVIRPTFGGQPEPAEDTTRERIEHCTGLHDYGAAGGHMVGLIRVDEGGGATSLSVLVGSEGTDEVTIVATLPDTAEGEETAETVALAVLRALRIASEPPPT